MIQNDGEFGALDLLCFLPPHPGPLPGGDGGLCGVFGSLSGVEFIQSREFVSVFATEILKMLLRTFYD